MRGIRKMLAIALRVPLVLLVGLGEEATPATA
jgi:hypothetical protein